MIALDGYALAPEIHRAAEHQLYFVRLDFEPVFPDVTDRLRERLLLLGASAAHVYELIGGHDLLLRVWHSGDIRGLIEGLDLPDMRRADFMAVRRQPTYWADQSTQSTAQVTREHAALLARALKENARAELGPFINDGTIIDILGRPGVKFAVAVSATTGHSTSINFDDVLYRHVSRILDAAGDLIFDRSVYSGDGFARLLIMGRFNPARYFDFMDKVVFALSDDYMRDLFSARTVTAFGTRPDPIIAVENLSTYLDEAARDVPPPRAVPVDALLTRGESQELEVKASAFLNFDRLVASNEPDWSKLRPEFVKAVCGLLNQHSADAATLLVGAVETDRYREWLTAHDGSLPRLGAYTVIGIEEDHPSGDWDAYQRRITDALDKAIRPSPVPYVTISVEDAVPDASVVRKVLRLELKPQPYPFYELAGDKLWVRTGAQVRELHGEDRDRFVRSMSN